METQNLEWLIFNALHGDINGDIPEDLQVMIKAEQELHALLTRHNALVEAVKWERECEGFDPFFHSSFTAPSWLSRHAESHRTKQAARAEVGRLIGEE